MKNLVDFLVGSTDRGPSPSIWGNCPWEEIKERQQVGCWFWDDFMSSNITVQTTEGDWNAGNAYSQFSDTGGTITADTTELGGAVAIGSDGDNEMCSFRTTIAPFKLAYGGKKFWFEARILTSTIADTKHDIFIGLMENVALSSGIPITTSGALADKNLVGFFRPESAKGAAGTGGATINTMYKCDGVTAVTVQNDITTLVASTYVKLGMIFDPDKDNAGPNTLSFYVNGTRCSTVKTVPSAAGTDFPNDINLGLVFAIMNATGSSPGTSSIDWWRAAQLF